MSRFRVIDVEESKVYRLEDAHLVCRMERTRRFDECPKGRGSAGVKNPTDPIVQALPLVTDRRDGQGHSMLDHRHLAAVEDRQSVRCRLEQKIRYPTSALHAQ